MLEILKRVSQTGITESQSITYYSDHRISGWRENQVLKLSTGEILAIYTDASQLLEKKIQDGSDFVSLARHELMTPLTALKGYVDLLKLGYAEQDKTRFDNCLDIMYDNILRLENISDRIMDEITE